MRKTRVVVITGASAGVGRATARAFATRGDSVALLARGRAGLEAARREIEDIAGAALALPTDVSNQQQVEAAAGEVERALGPIDVWINCAMVTTFAPVKETTAEEYRRVMEVNFLGYVHGTLAALRRMSARDRGAIVQVSSALALRSIPLRSAYCASKRAIVGFTESLRTELIHDGSRVRVTMVHLPAINTPQFEWSRSRMPRRAQPMPPIFQPEVAASAILHAADHPEQREITVGGSSLKAIWGEKLAPGLLDRRLAKVGYERQLSDEPHDPNRPDNLFSPVDVDLGTRGRFDARAKPRSLELQLRRHLGWVSIAGVVAIAGAMTWRSLRS